MSKYTIKQIFIDHWSEFQKLFTVRHVVSHEVNKMINCQNPDWGYALYFCEHCNKFMHVPFTCKSRFCNCCGIKYQKDRADAISAKLINYNHRHIVFTIPEELRIFFRQKRSLLFTASSRTVLDWLYSLNKSQNFKPGIITALHTFGRDLKWNPHIHMLITEGAFGNSVVWRKKVRKMLSHWEERIELSFGYNPCVYSCGHKMVFIELCGIKPIAHSSP